MKTWETAKSGILWIPDRICNCFTSLRSIKQAKKAIFGIFPDFSDIFGDSWCAAFWAKKGTPVCQLLNAFPTLPDIYFIHKSGQIAELPSRESIFDQISCTENPPK